ncbi:helix-turn-helix domain-containing protein [Colwellia sp. 12G3]|uniref:helix-turn-helix domain-containing protein n=1 Tax=Colwellia sp. 12G3 TaxID=2058299 RepID=UPI000C31C5D9|nr:AraC family transcriptional regulator [Colwellia sp. 12G3]PKI16186.1 hypothetical protein CXF71_11125 [Colwellia sp. 12G3]
MRSNIDEARRLAVDVIKAEPVMSQFVATRTPFHIERFICAEQPPKTIALPALVFGLQFAGTNVQANTLEVSSSSSVTLFPLGVDITYQMKGNVDFSIIYVEPITNALTKKIGELLMSLMGPIVLHDALLDALIRQLISSCSMYKDEDLDYLNAISSATLMQIDRILHNKKSILLNSNSAQLPRIRESVTYIHTHLDGDLSIANLSQLAHVSPSYFRILFLEVTGNTVHQFIIKTRLERARELLLHSDLAITHIADKLGFNSQSHLTTQFAKANTLTPAQFRKKLHR